MNSTCGAALSVWLAQSEAAEGPQASPAPQAELLDSTIIHCDAFWSAWAEPMLGGEAAGVLPLFGGKDREPDSTNKRRPKPAPASTSLSCTRVLLIADNLLLTAYCLLLIPSC